MPISLSAKKSLRSSLAKRKVNLVWRKKYREAVRAFSKLNDEKGLNALYSVLDKMAKKNIFHKNKVARLKANFSKKMKKATKGVAKKVSKTSKQVKKK